MIEPSLTGQQLDRPTQLARAAQALATAERDCVPIDPLSTQIPDLTVVEAYEIASLRTASMNRPIIGYKLGYTTEAMRRQMGVNEPNFGVLLEGSQLASGQRAPVGELIHPLVEPELTFLMGRELAAPDINREAAWDAVDVVYASLEIVDTRYRSYGFKAVDNIADNSSAARFVLGDGIGSKDITDIGSVQALLACDDVEVGRGKGADALGDPVLALLWLVRSLAANGERLKAGQFVMTGGLTAACNPRSGSRISASFSTIGSVAVQF